MLVPSEYRKRHNVLVGVVGLRSEIQDCRNYVGKNTFYCIAAAQLVFVY